MRYVLLDRITELIPGTRARGVKCVALSDDVFADHFPGYPVLPGALIVEALAQLGGVLLEATLRGRGRHDLHALLTMIDRTRFRRAVRPGDRLELEAQVETATEDGGRVKAWARLSPAGLSPGSGRGGDSGTSTVRGQAPMGPPPETHGALAAEADLGFAFATVTDPVLIARRREHLNVWLFGSVTEPA